MPYSFESQAPALQGLSEKIHIAYSFFATLSLDSYIGYKLGRKLVTNWCPTMIQAKFTIKEAPLGFLNQHKNMEKVCG
jgi:hypothetical protein